VDRVADRRNEASQRAIASSLLTATGGIESLTFADWFTWPSRFWSLGPVAAETLFDAGLRSATVQQYQSLYDVAVANYRQTTLPTPKCAEILAFDHPAPANELAIPWRSEPSRLPPSRSSCSKMVILFPRISPSRIRKAAAASEAIPPPMR
jgi:hypothetical protein